MFVNKPFHIEIFRTEYDSLLDFLPLMVVLQEVPDLKTLKCVFLHNSRLPWQFSYIEPCFHETQVVIKNS